MGVIVRKDPHPSALLRITGATRGCSRPGCVLM